ncbi:protein FAR1-RELATED SEQUENCE 5-like [Bidens hawaiensis]|uniref:protein FAR1-RELATED SEQUENCE 5-like n=1 Tax=Bidens hawaiensis TaxID=980011 RepID=UPI00404A0AFB
MVADSDMQFVRSARKLTHVQEKAIYELSNMNLGPVKAFNLMRTQYSGFEKVDATKDDCKNFKQGLNCYIGEFDAEMIVKRLCVKKNFSSDYSFEYDVNDDRELIRVFWADEISKSNYLAFGDITSFDATFKTNKYKMVFVPFMEIDNHCHSSFGHAPKVVVTDQDPSMNSCEEERCFLRCKIMDFNAYVPGFLEVVFKKVGEFGEESIATCSSKRFEQYGLLCRHIFYVMNMYRVKKFPKRYINDRWRKVVAMNIRIVPMSEFGNDQIRKIK